MNLLRTLLTNLWNPIRAFLTAPQKLLTVPGRLWAMSIPAKGAWLTFLFLVVCAITLFVSWRLDPERLDNSWSFWTPTKLMIVIPLGLLTPWVVYWALRIWLEGEASPFPDIDEAWRAGLHALSADGIDLRESPLFLVLGSSGPELERALFDASRVDLSVRGAPGNRAALAWYASPDGVYLVASQVGCLSRLAAEGLRIVLENAVLPALEERDTDGSGSDDIRGTMVGGAAGGGGPREKRSASARPGGSEIRGTMRIGGGYDDETIEGGEQPAAVEKKPIQLSKEDYTLQVKRLEHLGKLLRRARQPLCPLNGVLTLLSFPVLQWSSASGPQVQRAMKEDLRALQRAVEVRCPVTTLVVGLEEETGFRELVRRVGRENTRNNRFGHGYGVWNPPTAENLAALVAHACGAFEDWVYNLFREKNSLSKPGNARLYALLCKVRRDLQNRLANVLVAGLAVDADKGAAAEPLLFSGCYFAGTGVQDDRQAFVKSVFDKLPDLQEDLEWTEAALAREQRLRRGALTVWLIDAVLLAGLAALIYGRFR